MKFVIVNGSSCSGKSTIVKNIMKRKEHFFHLSYDSLRWLFSKYSPDEHSKDVQAVVLAVVNAVFKLKYNIISDSALYDAQRKKLIDLAVRAGYEILEINLEAEHDVLLKRFNKRVEGALKNPGIKISNLSKDRFNELHDIFHKEKNPSAITFRTDTQNVEEVSESIMKLL